MGKLITGLVGIIGALWLGLAGAGLMWWWDHRPAGDPAWAHVDFLWVHWRAPNSLAAQRDADLAAFQTDKRSFDVVYGALEQQNAAVRLLGQRATAWQAASRQAEVRAQAANAWRLSLADQILATPRPTDDSAAAQCKAAEGVLRETAQ